MLEARHSWSVRLAKRPEAKKWCAEESLPIEGVERKPLRSIECSNFFDALEVKTK